MKPLILINFKSYERSSGRNGLKLAKVVDKFKSTKYQLAVAPQLVDLKEISRAVKVPVFAQHIDNVGAGAHTGSVLPEGVKGAGAKGTLLNHSEKRISLKEIKAGVEICKRVKLVSVVCASSLRMVKKVVRFAPDYIAYEPKRLIGKNISVTSVNPRVISKVVKLVKGKTKVLVGAGVHSKKDVLTALELGAVGVLIAHKVVKAKNVRNVLKMMFT